VYHLCQESKWTEAKKSGAPYFPPTYVSDGKFTRMTVNRDDLVSTANEYYRDSPAGDGWIVLEIDCAVLYGLGIAIFASDAPESKNGTRGKNMVGGSSSGKVVKCLRVYGGVSTTHPGLVAGVYRMQRLPNGAFVKLIVPPRKGRHQTAETKPLVDGEPEAAPAAEQKRMNGEKGKKKAAAKEKNQKKGSFFFGLGKSR